jgi:nickel-dependent lactate racemase
VVEIWLPYGLSEIPARIPEERLVDILEPEKGKAILDPASEVKRVIESNRSFLDAAREARRICVVLGPSSNGELASTVARTMVESLIAVGVLRSSVTLLRTADAPELNPTLLDDLGIILHDPISSSMVPLKDSKHDFPLSLNSTFADADLRILLGELKPHHFLGYSGLSDVIFPGLASWNSAQSQLSDRKGMAVSDLHRERVEIANSFKNVFALGFVLDADRSPVKMSLGAFQDCLEDLEKAVQTACLRRVDRAADVVVMSAGGKPADESLLSAVETLPAALPVLRKDGVLIVAAECPSGHGNAEFYEWCAERKEPRYLEARLKHSFNYQGFKAAFLLRTLESHRIYLVSTIPDHYVQNVFGMRAAATVNSALQTLQHTLGSSSTISVIPDAARIITAKADSDDAKQLPTNLIV